MSDSPEEVMERIRAWATGQWKPFRDQAIDIETREPSGGTLEQRVQRLEDERDIVRVLRRYHQMYNSGDAEGVANGFTEDGIQVNTRGVYVGRDSIRRNYEWLCANQRYAEHISPDPQVTIDADDPDKALMTCRHMGFVVPWKGTASVYGGNYIFRTQRVDGRWLIREMRITHNVQFDIEPSRRKTAGARPEPDLPLNQVDLIEDQYLLALPLP